MGWHKITEWLCYNFCSAATKQHVVSMLIDQQQTATETLQEIAKIFRPATQIQQPTTTLGKRVGSITHFICNLHNHKLQHYVLGKNPSSVQKAITLEQKKDAELHIIEGLHSHDSVHDVNNITNKQNDDQNNMGSCHACSGPHLI